MDQFTFDGHEISGADADGEELFRHTYQYDGLDEATGMYVFESADEGSGELTYLCLAPDSPASTYHIEFRYGSDLDALGSFDAGPYAYWMAAGIPVDADRAMVEDCIALFCTENLAG